MIERKPGEPPPAAGHSRISASLASDPYLEPLVLPGAEDEAAPAEPPKSFFRGVAVGIAIMIPIWAWIILKLVH